jgi:hypothetical protein
MKPSFFEQLQRCVRWQLGPACRRVNGTAGAREGAILTDAAEQERLHMKGWVGLLVASAVSIRIVLT